VENVFKNSIGGEGESHTTLLIINAVPLLEQQHLTEQEEDLDEDYCGI